MNIKASIFNPFSNTDHGIKDFKILRKHERVLTIVVAALAALACSPLFIIGGICAGTATFRLLAEKFAKARNVDPQNLKKEHPHRKAQEATQPQLNPQPFKEAVPENKAAKPFEAAPSNAPDLSADPNPLNPQPVKEAIPEDKAAKPFEAAPSKAPDLSADPNPLMNDNQDWADWHLPVPKLIVKPVLNWKIQNDVLYLVMDEASSAFIRQFKDVRPLQLCLDLKNYRMDFFDEKNEFIIRANAPLPATVKKKLERTYRGPKQIRLYLYWTPDTNRPYYHLHLKELRPKNGYAVEQKV